MRKFATGLFALLVAAGGCATPTPESSSNSERAEDEREPQRAPLAGVRPLAARVELVLDAYLRGDGLEQALDGWRADREASAFEESARSFRKSARSRGARRTAVPAVVLEFGVLRGERAGRATGPSMQALALVGDSEVTLAGLRPQSTPTDTMARDDIPDNAPLIDQLADDLLPALMQPATCRSLPIADKETVRDRLPPGRRTDRLVETHEGADDRLDGFCKRIDALSERGPPRLRISPFIGIAKDENDLRVGHLQLEIARDADGDLHVSRWPKRLAGGDAPGSDASRTSRHSNGP